MKHPSNQTTALCEDATGRTKIIKEHLLLNRDEFENVIDNWTPIGSFHLKDIIDKLKKPNGDWIDCKVNSTKFEVDDNGMLQYTVVPIPPIIVRSPMGGHYAIGLFLGIHEKYKGITTFEFYEGRTPTSIPFIVNFRDTGTGTAQVDYFDFSQDFPTNAFKSRFKSLNELK